MEEVGETGELAGVRGKLWRWSPDQRHLLRFEALERALDQAGATRACHWSSYSNCTCGSSCQGRDGGDVAPDLDGGITR